MVECRLTVKGCAVPNMPWQERPTGCSEVVWRYSGNPIIPRDLLPTSNSIFNSAVVPFEGKFAGVFRCDNKARRMLIHSGRSEDGVNWVIDPEPIRFVGGGEEIGRFEYAYDPRVCRIEDRYYVIWCNGYHGPTIGLGYTHDFQTFHQLENAFLPYNRNGVLFPRKINDRYAMLSRPSDTGHTPFGDMFYSESPDLEFWGRHRHVMSPLDGWQSTKVGPVPIETSEGWLVIYHGVLTSCNGFVYHAGVVLLDLDEPWKVIARTDPYILNPRTQYECVGDVPNVVFPCAALCDAPSGRLAIYYGPAQLSGNSADCQRDAEAVVGEGSVGGDAAAGGAGGDFQQVAPGATAGGAAHACFSTGGIAGRRGEVVVGRIPVGAPLVDEIGHVVEAVRVRWIAADAIGALDVVSAVVGIHPVGQVVTPGIALAFLAATAGFFALRFSRQPIGSRRLFAQP